jgi:hypothetical protein
MHATNLFGRGFGTKKFQLILTAEPTILSVTDMDVAEKISRIAAIEGLATKTAEQFVQQIPIFLAFLMETNLLGKLHQDAVKDAVKGNPRLLEGKHYVMTGFRDKALMEKLAAHGAEAGSAVKKTTFVLLVKDTAADTTKIKEAKTFGIPIMTPDDFISKYQL